MRSARSSRRSGSGSRARRGAGALVVPAAVLLGSAGGLQGVAVASPDGARGEALYELACATCHHGGGGLLGAPRAPDLLRDPLPRGEDRAALARAIREGVAVPRMPAFEAGLSPEEIQAIVDYLLERRAARLAGRRGGGD